MSLFDGLGDLIKQVSNGNAPASEVHAAYDQVAGAVPSGTIADALSHAFKSDQTPPFEQMVSGLFAQSTPDQKAALLDRLVAALGPAAFGKLLADSGLGSALQTAASGGGLTPQQASQLTPETVQVLAQQAAAKDPSIIDKAASFYAEHPTLVKSIGVGALALLMSNISKSRR